MTEKDTASYFFSRNPVEVEVIDQPLFDTRYYANHTEVLDFFETPMGQVDRLLPGHDKTKSHEETNLYHAHRLPEGNAFLVKGIALDVGRGGMPLLQAGAAELRIGAKTFLLVAPLLMLARYRIRVHQVDQEDFRKNNYAPYQLQLDSQLLIKDDIGFGLRLSWRNPPTVKRPVKIRAELIGEWYRPTQ